jgi:hypothetical protein
MKHGKGRGRRRTDGNLSYVPDENVREEDRHQLNNKHGGKLDQQCRCKMHHEDMAEERRGVDLRAHRRQTSARSTSHAIVIISQNSYCALVLIQFVCGVMVHMSRARGETYHSECNPEKSGVVIHELEQKGFDQKRILKLRSRSVILEPGNIK